MLTIGAVSRQTGISSATLRKWEARYGFPVPQRSVGGQRAFCQSDLDALFEISRLIASGQRAGEAIRALRQRGLQGQVCGESRDSPVTQDVDAALTLLLQGAFIRFEKFLEAKLSEQGIQGFSRHVAVPLIEAVGAAWQAGTLPVYAEHIFSNTLQNAVNCSVLHPPDRHSRAPRVLLASPAGEMHSLVLFLIDALLRDAGISPVFLHGGLPAAEIAAAVSAYDTQFLLLSASVVYPPKLLRSELLSLRTLLPGKAEIWVGGAGTHRIPTGMKGISVMTSIEDAVRKLRELHMPAAITDHPEQIQER